MHYPLVVDTQQTPPMWSLHWPYSDFFITKCFNIHSMVWLFGTLQGRHNKRDVVLNRRRLDSLLNCLFRCRSKNISKFRVTGLCEGNPHRWPVDFSHKGQVTRKMTSFDDVIMIYHKQENGGIIQQGTTYSSYKANMVPITRYEIAFWYWNKYFDIAFFIPWVWKLEHFCNIFFSNLSVKGFIH